MTGRPSPGVEPATPGAARRALAGAVPALAVVALGLLAHATSLDVPLQFDDVPNIVDEPAVHATALTADQLARAASGFPLGRWLARGSFAVNHALHGLRPAGYHLVNVAFHLAAALLVLAVARRLLEALAASRDAAGGAALGLDGAGRRRAAAIAAVLFAVHPVHTQAVTYVVQRMTVMGAFFALLAVWLWLCARARHGGAFAWRAAGAAVCTWLAVSCKENYVVVPALVLLVEWVLDPALGARLRARWRAWSAAGAAVALAGGALFWAYLPVLRHEAMRFALSPGTRLLSQGRILVHYLSLLALPLPGRLHVDYAYPPSTGLLDPKTTLPALLAIAALAALAVQSRRRAPLVALAIGWFFVALSVEQSVLPLDLVFEQRLYFASVGPLLLAAAALVRFVRVPRAGAWALAAPVAALLVAGTWARNARWRDPALLYADEEGSRPGAARGLLNVGATYRARGQLEEAERVLRRAVALAPDEAGAYVNLGNVELDRGRLAEAERWYREALARDRRLPDVWYDLGILLTRRGELANAMDAYRQALSADATYASARVNLALLQHRTGDRTGALATLDEAVRLDPGAVSALSNRAVLRAVAGRGPEALEDAREAVRLGGERPVPWLVLAQVHLVAGRRAEAREAAARALRVDPGNADARDLVRALAAER